MRTLDNDKAILLIRGEKPIIDRKYNILKHPNVKDTTDGKAKPYEHGRTDRANASILQLEPNEIDIDKVKDITEYKQIEKNTAEILSEEDIEIYYLMEEYENGKEQENKK